MKHLRTIVMLLMLPMLFIGCEPSGSQTSSDAVQSRETKQALSEANRQIGMPAIKNYQERKLAKQIFELRDQEDLVTYAYIVDLNGNLIFLGQAIGYGLPYSVQYTAPQRPSNVEDEYGIYAYQGEEVHMVPQADPNGLFMPEGLSATWLQLIDPSTGDIRVVYVEPEIIVSPFKLH